MKWRRSLCEVTAPGAVPEKKKTTDGSSSRGRFWTSIVPWAPAAPARVRPYGRSRRVCARASMTPNLRNDRRMHERDRGDQGKNPPKSLAWRCLACGYYQLFDAPGHMPAFCKLCGSREMVTAGLADPAEPPPRGRG
jgi:hypothetical protein